MPLNFGVDSKLEPEFSPTHLHYKLNVPNDITQVEIKIKAEDSEDEILVNGQKPKIDDEDDTSGYSIGIDLDEGENILNIDVIDSYTKETTSYKLTIIREDLSDVRAEFEYFTYTSPNTGISMPYRLYIPESYDEKSSDLYPIIMSLHGSGERGFDNNKQLSANLVATKWATDEVQDKQEMFVLAPQARYGDETTGFGLTYNEYGQYSEEHVYEVSDDAQTAKEILELIIKDYNIDTDRVYGIGVSQGAFGTWALNLKYPDLYTAIITIGGGADESNENLKELVDQPIWSFHAAEDPAIPAQLDRDVVEELQSMGSSIRYTEYPEGTYFFPDSHHSWIPAMHNEKLVNWLIAQSK